VAELQAEGLAGAGEAAGQRLGAQKKASGRGSEPLGGVESGGGRGRLQFGFTWHRLLQKSLSILLPSSHISF